MKKQKVYQRPKRTTFLKLFARNMIFAVLATVVFSGAVFEINTKDIYEQVRSALEQKETEFMSKINNPENDTSTMNLNAYLSLYTHYGAMLETLPSEMLNSGMGQYASEFSENCHAISVIVDENKNILYSSKKRLVTFIRLEEGENPKNGFYSCELEEIPEILQAYQEIKSKNWDKFSDYVRITLSSVYVDIENHRFIPHEAELHLEHSSNSGPLTETQILETKTITIDFNDDDYEFIQLKPSTESEPPYAWITGFHGTEEQVFNEMLSEFDGIIWPYTGARIEDGVVRSGMAGISSTARIYYASVPVWIDGQKNYLITVFQIDVRNAETQKLYFTAVGYFFLLMSFIAFRWSLHKHRINQITYQFEDYQRTLTNNLAHDIKTPLMAINGYAENLLSGYSMEAQPKQYLESILENVSYTDSIINKTLELNKIQEIRTLKKSNISLNEFTRQIIHKYESPLEEHDILLTLEGDRQIKANPDMLSACIENLISNAVKYTPHGKQIQILINQKQFRISNDCNAPVDTKNLLLPFVKGDKARTDKSSSGLGLSIAQNAAEVNGFRLEISSKDNQFTATILF